MSCTLKTFFSVDLLSERQKEAFCTASSCCFICFLPSSFLILASKNYYRGVATDMKKKSLGNWVSSRPWWQHSGARFLDPALVTSCCLEKEKLIFKPSFTSMTWWYCLLMMSGLNVWYWVPERSKKQGRRPFICCVIIDIFRHFFHSHKGIERKADSM